MGIIGQAIAANNVQANARLEQLLNQPRGNAKVANFSSCDPEEWHSWRHAFEHAAQINAWDDERARREASRHMTKTAYSSVRLIPVFVRGAPPAPVDGAPPGLGPMLPYGDLLDAYENRFCPAAGSAAAKDRLKSAQQKPDETMLEWSARISHLYQRVHVNVAADQLDANGGLRDAFIDGLRVKGIRKTMRGTHYDDYTAAYNHATRLEAAESTEANRARERTGINSLGSNNQAHIQCYNCKRYGHYQSACRQPRRDNSAVTKPSTQRSSTWSGKPSGDRTGNRTSRGRGGGGYRGRGSNPSSSRGRGRGGYRPNHRGVNAIGHDSGKGEDNYSDVDPDAETDTDEVDNEYTNKEAGN